MACCFRDVSALITSADPPTVEVTSWSGEEHDGGNVALQRLFSPCARTIVGANQEAVTGATYRPEAILLSINVAVCGSGINTPASMHRCSSAATARIAGVSSVSRIVVASIRVHRGLPDMRNNAR